ncbi:MAG: lamin tail domain-containing protein, partial [Planctomycetota bacterium]
MRELNRVAFSVTCLAVVFASRADALQITEILYHPPGDGVEAGGLEWVEIYNGSATVVDVSEHYFSRGIQFTFPAQTYISGRGYVVVCSNLDAFKERYPEVENVLGDFEGRLDNAGERVEISNASGSVVTGVRYGDGGLWPTQADGTGYTLTLRSPIADSSKVANWTHSDFPWGNPGIDNFPEPIPIDTEIFPRDEQTWRWKPGWDAASEMIAEYSDPPAAWRDPAFDDESWAEGIAPIGFGEDEIITVIEGMEDNYFSIAARKHFEVSAEAIDEMASFTVSLALDDGAVVYINGTEAARTGMAGAPGEDVAAGERAIRSGEISRAPQEFRLDKKLLRAGDNVICLQVHNLNLGSGDFGFSCGMTYRTFRVHNPPVLPKIYLNELTWGENPTLEIVSLDDNDYDLSEMYLSNESDRLDAWPFPKGTVLRSGQFLTVPLADLPFEWATLPGRVFLTSFNGDQFRYVIDAMRLPAPNTQPADSWSHARVPDAYGRVLISESPTLGGTNEASLETGLVINEINYHPIDNGELEFVEIYNRSDRAISLDGMALTSGYNFRFGKGDQLDAGAYLVLARNPSALSTAYELDGVDVYGPAADATPEDIEAFGRLSNQGEKIQLNDRFGNPIDIVRYYDGGSWDPLSDGGGSSLELLDPNQDNNAASAWASSDESARSEWTEVRIEGSYRSLPPSQMEPE